MKHTSRSLRPLLSAVVTLLVVMLPALVAGVGIDQPVRATERALVDSAVRDPGGAAFGPASLFVRTFLDVDAVVEPARAEAAIGVARLASVLGVFACTGLLYLAVMLARGRGVAVLSCVAFAALPPVRVEGALLRPEVPCAMFGMLGLLLLVGMPTRVRSLRRRSKFARRVELALLALAIAVATALAAVTMQDYGVYLLVPAGCMTIVAVQQAALLARVLRRFRLLVLPFRAFTARVAPWTAAAFGSLAFAALLLPRSHGPELPTLAGVGLLPESTLVAGVVVVSASVGALLRVVHVGLELGRRTRFDATAVLLVFVVVMLLQRLRFDRTEEALPAAPALAILVAEGVGALLVVTAARLGGLRRRVAVS